jgi:hypothetical protein
MSNKGRSREINDILDAAFTEPDYNHYDEERDYRRPRNTGFGGLRNSIQVANDTKQEKNMFLKYSQNDTNLKKIDTQNVKQIVVDDNNFPSLGGGSNSSSGDKHNSQQQSPWAQKPATLNFKKVVTTPIVAPTENTNMNTKEQSASRGSYYNKSNSYLTYNRIRDNSEKIARYKMESEYSSDDEY